MQVQVEVELIFLERRNRSDVERGFSHGYIGLWVQGGENQARFQEFLYAERNERG